MNDNPLISILVPCYNVEKYVRQCMESIVNQTYTNLEIICLNDGSTDETLDILNEYKAKDGRIIVVDKPNSGYGATMNIGLRMATGKYIGIVESDDYIEPEMYEILCNEAEKENLDIVRCRFYERNEITQKTTVSPHYKEVNSVFKPLDILSILIVQPAIWATLYNRNFLQVNGISFLETPGASYQDASFAFKTLVMAQRVRFLPDILHNYRINGSSSVSSPGKVFCVCDEDAEIRRYVREHGLYEQLKEIMAFKTFWSYKWNYNRLKSLKLKRAFMKQWSKEVSQMFTEDSITRKFFSKRHIRKLWKIAYCPFVYYFTREI